MYLRSHASGSGGGHVVSHGRCYERGQLLYLRCVRFVEEECSLGGRIIIRLDNGAFVGLIYELLVFS